MTTMRVVGECFFWYRLTRVFPDKFHRAVKRLCVVCVCVVCELIYIIILQYSLSFFAAGPVSGVENVPTDSTTVTEVTEDNPDSSTAAEDTTVNRTE